MCRLVVYTAISKGYDNLKSPPDKWRKEANFVAFLDEGQASPGWEILPLHKEFKDPCRNAKIHKILAHKFFPKAEYSLWIDGSISINPATSPRQFVDSFLARHDLAVFRHRRRNCIYKEARACLKHRKDIPEVILAQIQKYRAEGYPPRLGLAECTVLLRRHTQQIERFNEAWHKEIVLHSRRDQLSFNYTAAKLGLEYQHFPGTISRNSLFVWGPHLSHIH